MYFIYVCVCVYLYIFECMNVKLFKVKECESKYDLQKWGEREYINGIGKMILCSEETVKRFLCHAGILVAHKWHAFK